MNVCGFGFTLQCAFKHFLCCYKFSAVQLDDTAIIKRVGIAR